MKHLKYLSDHVWNRLPPGDFRLRFFVEAYSEKLRMSTPHFFQGRLMNVFSAAAELLTYLTEYEANDRNGAYVVCAVEELTDCWAMDVVAQEQLAGLIALRTNLSKLNVTGGIDSHTIQRLKGIARAILSRKEGYGRALLSALEEGVFGQADLTQRDRLTNSIDRLAGLYVSYLLNEGFSPTYLYNRSEMFTRDSNYSGRSLVEQFRYVTDRLSTNTNSFDVVFGLHTNKPSQLLGVQGEQGIAFVGAVPPEIQGPDLEKLRKGIEINVALKASIESTDYVSAALRTKEKLDQLLDASTALEPLTELQVSSHCVVAYPGPTGGRHVHTLSTDLLLTFMSSEGGSWLPEPDQPIWDLLRGLNATAREQLGRSLRYLRVARNSVSTEQKLLNLWIALESLFTSSESNIIANILECVPQLYATTGLVRRIRYLRSLLIANEVAVTPQIRGRICIGMDRFNDSLSDGQTFQILRDDPAAVELFQSLGSLEHLKFKMKQVHAELQDNKAITQRIGKSGDDVNRQLRRIYFVRNKIAHTGHFAGVRPQLVTHLLDYLSVAYWSIAVAFSRANTRERYSIGDLLVAARLGGDVVAARANAKDPISSLEQLALVPVV